MNRTDGSSPRFPDFIIIGAMKCATTTLHEQLSRQPGIVMSEPKEPNFFSNDEIYARGTRWYSSLFRETGPGELCGESSTHYSKRPTYPQTVARLARDVPAVRLVYVMRHPIDRLTSHFRHERSVGRLGEQETIEQAVAKIPELIDYGRYSWQIAPYLDAFGAERVLPVFFRRLVERPREEFERIGRFLGYPGTPRWDPTVGALNVGRQRLRHSPLRHALVSAPVLTPLRQKWFPRSLYTPLRTLWRDRSDSPPPGPDLTARLQRLFDDDLGQLGDSLGVRLDCETFKAVVRDGPLDWTGMRRA